MSNHCEEAKNYRDFYKKQLLENVIPFWMNSDLIDKENGGYISSVDRIGKSYNDDKSVWFQGRCLWTFSTLCEKYGIRDDWRQAAESGKKFMEEHCFDTDGRMFFTVTKEGKPLRKRRYMFSESFFVVGMAQYGKTFNDSQALKKAEDCFDLMMNIYKDPSSDPFKITPKSYIQTRDERSASVPMVLISSAELLRRCDPQKSQYYNDICKSIANDILKYHYHPELKCSLETVLSADGSHIDNPAGRTINPGHSCENAWFLMCQAIYNNDESLLNDALSIFDFAFERGWDKEYGGILYFTDLDNRPCEQLEWDMKLWWVHNEALIASLMAYAITKNEKYWERFELVHNYSFNHFADNEYGEWYGYLHRDGTVSHTQKGSLWKGPYHLPRCLMFCEELLSNIADNQKPKSLL